MKLIKISAVLICAAALASCTAEGVASDQSLVGGFLERIAAGETDPAPSEDVAEYPDGTVYWTKGGSVWHVSPDCSALSKADEILSGSAAQSGKERGCSVCEEGAD